MSIKDWIEKRIQEMKSDNVIPLENWREYYNNKEKQREEKEKKRNYLIKQKKDGIIFGCLEIRRVRPKVNWKEIKDRRLGGSGIIQLLQFFLVYLLFYCCGLELIYR